MFKKLTEIFLLFFFVMINVSQIQAADKYTEFAVFYTNEDPAELLAVQQDAHETAKKWPGFIKSLRTQSVEQAHKFADVVLWDSQKNALDGFAKAEQTDICQTFFSKISESEIFAHGVDIKRSGDADIQNIKENEYIQLIELHTEQAEDTNSKGTVLHDKLRDLTTHYPTMLGTVSYITQSDDNAQQNIIALVRFASDAELNLPTLRRNIETLALQLQAKLSSYGVYKVVEIHTGTQKLIPMQAIIFD